MHPLPACGAPTSGSWRAHFRLEEGALRPSGESCPHFRLVAGALPAGGTRASSPWVDSSGPPPSPATLQCCHARRMVDGGGHTDTRGRRGPGGRACALSPSVCRHRRPPGGTAMAGGASACVHGAVTPGLPGSPAEAAELPPCQIIGLCSRLLPSRSLLSWGTSWVESWVCRGVPCRREGRLRSSRPKPFRNHLTVTRPGQGVASFALLMAEGLLSHRQHGYGWPMCLFKKPDSSRIRTQAMF